MIKTFITLFSVVLFFVANAQQPSRFGEKSDSTKTEQNADFDDESARNSSQVDARRATPPRTKSNFMERARFGGMVGLSFGTYTYIELSPRMHYLVKDNLGVGAGISYYYWKDNNTYPPGFNIKTEGNVYGFSLFSWFNPVGPIVLQGEFEPLNFEVYDFESNTWEREWVNGLLLGGGIRQQAGRVNMFFIALYNVLYDPNRTFYSSPWVIRIGAGF